MRADFSGLTRFKCLLFKAQLSFFLILSFCPSLFAKSAQTFSLSNSNEPLNFLLILIALALLPIFAIMTTTFAKIVVVLSIARQAIGTPQAPPNLVIVSLSIILTAFSMHPVFVSVIETLEAKNYRDFKEAEHFLEAAESISPIIKDFLKKHTNTADLEIFKNILNKNNNNNNKIENDDLIILAPAFLISELSSAFQIAFLIFLPFVVVDMIVANILMALGMQMLAPTTVSLPFKLLLFVLVDGWRLLAEGLMKV
jgi:type III secretion protein R